MDRTLTLFHGRREGHVVPKSRVNLLSWFDKLTMRTLFSPHPKSLSKDEAGRDLGNAGTHQPNLLAAVTRQRQQEIGAAMAPGLKNDVFALAMQAHRLVIARLARK